ncbi:hypothetical protein CAL7102_06415 [Dulcicalothrix desertica PCC 7102]|nr:hypothetical protein CAL7102_06415 [Dulcicalothrix desertica PCC 7102]
MVARFDVLACVIFFVDPLPTKLLITNSFNYVPYTMSWLNRMESSVSNSVKQRLRMR